MLRSQCVMHTRRMKRKKMSLQSHAAFVRDCKKLGAITVVKDPGSSEIRGLLSGSTVFPQFLGTPFALGLAYSLLILYFIAISLNSNRFMEHLERQP